MFFKRILRLLERIDERLARIERLVEDGKFAENSSSPRSG